MSFCSCGGRAKKCWCRTGEQRFNPIDRTMVPPNESCSGGATAAAVVVVCCLVVESVVLWYPAIQSSNTVASVS